MTTHRLETRIRRVLGGKRRGFTRLGALTLGFLSLGSTLIVSTFLPTHADAPHMADVQPAQVAMAGQGLVDWLQHLTQSSRDEKEAEAAIAEPRPVPRQDRLTDSVVLERVAAEVARTDRIIAAPKSPPRIAVRKGEGPVQVLTMVHGGTARGRSGEQVQIRVTVDSAKDEAVVEIRQGEGEARVERLRLEKGKSGRREYGDFIVEWRAGEGGLPTVTVRHKDQESPIALLMEPEVLPPLRDAERKEGVNRLRVPLNRDVLELRALPRGEGGVRKLALPMVPLDEIRVRVQKTPSPQELESLMESARVRVGSASGLTPQQRELIEKELKQAEVQIRALPQMEVELLREFGEAQEEMAQAMREMRRVRIPVDRPSAPLWLGVRGASSLGALDEAIRAIEADVARMKKESAEAQKQLPVLESTLRVLKTQREQLRKVAPTAPTPSRNHLRTTVPPRPANPPKRPSSTAPEPKGRVNVAPPVPTAPKP